MVDSLYACLAGRKEKLMMCAADTHQVPEEFLDFVIPVTNLTDAFMRIEHRIQWNRRLRNILNAPWLVVFKNVQNLLKPYNFKTCQESTRSISLVSLQHFPSQLQYTLVLIQIIFHTLFFIK